MCPLEEIGSAPIGESRSPEPAASAAAPAAAPAAPAPPAGSEAFAQSRSILRPGETPLIPPAVAPAPSAPAAPVAPAAPASPPPWGTKTPDELWRENQELAALKGRMGNELGTIRQQMQQMQAALQQRQMAPAQVLPDLAAMAKKVDDGEITLADFARAQEQVVTARLEQQFNAKLEQGINSLRTEAERKDYVESFVKDNPGYVEAYESGKLDPYMQKGMSAQESWFAHSAATARQELDRLKAEAQARENKAREAGRTEGAGIASAATAASRVMGSPGGTMRAGKPSLPPHATLDQMSNAGVALIQRMRSQGMG